MSEKEERLVLAIIPAKERSETCPFCSTGEFWDMCSLYYKDGEADCDKCQEGIPRAEAVERMAKAMYVASWKRRTPLVRVTSWENGFADNMKKKYLLAAEAALDALVDK